MVQAWYVFQAFSGWELETADRLRVRHGVETFCPSLDGKIALFRGYAFARIDASDQSYYRRIVEGSPYAFRILTALPVADADVAQLQMECASGFISISAGLPPARPGDAVSISNGPLAGNV